MTCNPSSPNNPTKIFADSVIMIVNIDSTIFVSSGAVIVVSNVLAILSPFPFRGFVSLVANVYGKRREIGGRAKLPATRLKSYVGLLSQIRLSPVRHAFLI
jgi:hypothetical protein